MPLLQHWLLDFTRRQQRRQRRERKMNGHMWGNRSEPFHAAAEEWYTVIPVGQCTLMGGSARFQEQLHGFFSILNISKSYSNIQVKKERQKHRRIEILILPTRWQNEYFAALYYTTSCRFCYTDSVDGSGYPTILRCTYCIHKCCM